MAVLATARWEIRNKRMFQSGRETRAFEAVVNRVFSENTSQPISSGLRDKVNSKVTSDSLPIRIPSLAPIWRDSRSTGYRTIGRLGLLNCGDEDGTKDCVGTKSIKGVVFQSILLGRTMVGQNR